MKYICFECRILKGHKPKDNGCHTARTTECECCGDRKPILPERHWIVEDETTKPSTTN